MNPTAIGIFVFVSTFGGVLAGIWLHARLPQDHLSKESQTTVMGGIGSSVPPVPFLVVLVF